MSAGPHSPEVLRDLCARLRAQPVPYDRSLPSYSGTVYDVERDEIAAAVHFGVLELDRAATLRWELAPVIHVTHAARGPHKTFQPLP